MQFGVEDQPQEHLPQENCQHLFPSHGEPLQPLKMINDWAWFPGKKVVVADACLLNKKRKLYIDRERDLIVLFLVFSENGRLTSHECCWRYGSCKCNSSAFIFQNEMIIRMHEIMWFDKGNCRPLARKGENLMQIIPLLSRTTTILVGT